jgi:cyclic nucleotide-binding domain protein
MKSELNIQALTTCKVYICSSVILKQLFEETIENQRVARIAAEQLFFQTYTRYLDMYRLTPEERYDKLLERYPEVLQFISLKEIASYLNITPVHMSRIRSKIFK